MTCITLKFCNRIGFLITSEGGDLSLSSWDGAIGITLIEWKYYYIWLIIHLNGYVAHTPINGGLSQWSKWTSCSSVCGPGRQVRYRLCNSPHPKYGGSSCSKALQEEKDCKVKDCPTGLFILLVFLDSIFDLFIIYSASVTS